MERHKLSQRELMILQLVADGMTAKEIAVHLDISPLTVQKHVSNILRKTQARSRTEVAVKVVRSGLID